MQSASPVVFIVDDDVSVRESLELLLANEGWHVEAFATARDFLDRPRAQVASCLILDISLPDLNGLDLQQQVAAEHAAMPIIFITGYGDIPTTVRAMKAGAVEFLTKPLSDETLVNAVQQGLERSRAALGDEAAVREIQESYVSLTRRERQVMELVVAGLLNKQVGGELGISEITVKAHRGKVMEKMKARSFADLVRMATKLRAARVPDPTDDASQPGP